MNNLTDSPLIPADDWKISAVPSSETPASSKPDTENGASVATHLMQNVVQEAHESIDHFASSITPTVQSLEESLSDAKNLVHAKKVQLSETRAAWAESLRGPVRGNPLIAVAAALALGAAIGRVTR